MSKAKRNVILIIISFILLIVVPLAYLGFQLTQDLRSGATLGDNIAYSHRVLNNVGNRFSVAWITAESVASPGLRYGKCESTSNVDPSSLSLSGTNEIEISTGPAKVHMFKVTELDPGTKYCYQITNLKEENGVSSVNSIIYDVTTLPKVDDTLSTPEDIKVSVEDAFLESIVSIVMIERGTGKTISNEIGVPVAKNGTAVIPVTSFRLSSGNTVSNSIKKNALYFVSAFTFNQTDQILASSSSLIVESNINLKEDVVSLSVTNQDTTDKASEYPSTGESIAEEFLSEPTIQPTRVENINPSPVVRAQVVEIVKQPEIVNHNPLGNNFAVIWETNIPTDSYIEYSVNGGPKSNSFDPRSGRVFLRKLKTHYVEIIDTINKTGSYQITIINNGIRATTISHDRTTDTTSPPSPKPALNFSFSKDGNFIDQILVAEISGKSTKIATVPNVSGSAQLDTTKLAKLSSPDQPFDVATAETDPLKFTLLGGTITTAPDLPISSLPLVINLITVPTSDIEFKVNYINVNDSGVPVVIGGEGIEKANITIERN